MPQTLTLLTLVGNPRPRSRTFEAAVAVARQLAAALEAGGVQVAEDSLDLAELAPHLFEWQHATVEAAVQRLLAADVLVVASPTYKASYTGLLKAFLDPLPGNALAGRVAVPVMMGAAPIHSLAVEAYLRPLLVELGASCPTRGLYVLEAQLPDLGEVIARWLADAAPALAACGALALARAQSPPA